MTREGPRRTAPSLPVAVVLGLLVVTAMTAVAAVRASRVRPRRRGPPALLPA